MKKLPKAIRPAIDTQSDDTAATSTTPRTQPAATRTARRSAAPSETTVTAAPAADLVETAAVPLGPTAPAANDAALSAAPRRAEMEGTLRRERADAIVKRYAAYAAAGGLVPVPLVSFAGVAAIILRMVKQLSQHYGVPFERDRAQARVVSMMGGAVPAGIAAVAGSTVAYMIPASLLISTAVSTVVAAAATRTIGKAFIEHFESGATLLDLPPAGRA
jgi:uncharacterized protein (DUF697 family)